MIQEPRNSECTPLLGYAMSNVTRLQVRKKSVVLVIAENRFICFLYSCFLLLQMVGYILNLIKAVQCCLRDRHSMFECRNFTSFQYSQDIGLASAISYSTSIWLFLFVLTKTPQFLGWRIVFKKLIRLPSFWSLQLLSTCSIVRYVVILCTDNSKAVNEITIVLLIPAIVALTVSVSVLNYCKINPLDGIFPRHTFLLMKGTVVLLFIGTFISFAIGCLQLACDVIGLDDSGAISSEKFRIVFGFVGQTISIAFLHKVISFLWKKLFNDDEDILRGEENFWKL